MSFSASGSPDSVQSRRLEMPEFFSTDRVKARSISTFCWMCFWRLFVEGFVVFVQDPGGVEAEVDADVAVLLVGGLVELGAETDDVDGGWLRAPEGVEGDLGGWRGAGFGASRASTSSRTRRPCRRGVVRWPRRRRFR